MVKAWGIKQALLISIIWSVIRTFIQTVGVMTGAGVGIIIVQCSQVMIIFGGPAGYLLTLNSYATEVVLPSERTPVLGRVTGCAMFGTARCCLAGGILENKFSDIMHFEVVFGLFFVSTLYTYLSLPYIPLSDQELGAFFEPLKMLTRRIWTLKDGRNRQYGVLLLRIGAFLAAFATGYLTVLLQMYATDEFGFEPSDNSKLVSLNFMIRAAFLTFAFPAIVGPGRTWLDKKEGILRQSVSNIEVAETEQVDDLPIDIDRLAPTALPEGAAKATNPEEPVKRTIASQSYRAGTEENETFHFDLFHARYSLILDGILTSMTTFIATGWQLYVAAAVLPFAAGKGTAAKGVMLQMCAPEEKTDALSAISLLKSVVSLSTVGLFGLVFRGFAEVERVYLTFACNAAMVVIGFIALMFARFPPEGAARFRTEDAEEAGTGEWSRYESGFFDLHRLYERPPRASSLETDDQLP
jgi:hypothetical protein